MTEIGLLHDQQVIPYLPDLELQLITVVKESDAIPPIRQRNLDPQIAIPYLPDISLLFFKTAGFPGGVPADYI